MGAFYIVTKDKRVIKIEGLANEAQAKVYAKGYGIDYDFIAPVKAEIIPNLPATSITMVSGLRGTVQRPVKAITFGCTFCGALTGMPVDDNENITAVQCGSCGTVMKVK